MPGCVISCCLQTSWPIRSACVLIFSCDFTNVGGEPVLWQRPPPNNMRSLLLTGLSDRSGCGLRGGPTSMQSNGAALVVASTPFRFQIHLHVSGLFECGANGRRGRRKLKEPFNEQETTTLASNQTQDPQKKKSRTPPLAFALLWGQNSPTASSKNNFLLTHTPVPGPDTPNTTLPSPFFISKGKGNWTTLFPPSKILAWLD